jgi:uncharacterized protein DUF326
MHRTVERMLRTHPEPPVAPPELLASAIHACIECAQVCTACADACLGNHEPGALDHCMRLDLDCSDICSATARVLSRQLAPDYSVIAMALELCIVACDACAKECEDHGTRHPHCYVCAAACRRCADACRAIRGWPAEGRRLHH